MIKLKVGRRIAKYRNDQSLSQEELASIANIHRTYLASVESGKRNISIMNLEKIIKALNITFEEFFHDL